MSDRSLQRCFIGTSGWSYAAWKDGFYAGVPRRRWLRHCAERFGGIEVNMTFYREPRAQVLDSWVAGTPPAFAFACKGHRRITHIQRLAGIEAALARQRDSLRPLGTRLKAMLWQLPASLERDLDRLAAFARALAGWAEVAHAIEFRHPSWFDDAVADCLARRRIAICISDAGKWPRWDRVTAPAVYVRLHGRPETYASGYGAEALADWAAKVAGWLGQGRTVHVYFDNDARGAAPYDAMRLIELVRPRVKA